MERKAFLVALATLIVLSYPAYGQRSTAVGPSSTVVVPQTVLQTNYIEGKVVAWSPPILTVRGDSYFLEASGQPGYPGSKMTFEVFMQAAGLHGKVTYTYVYR